MLKRGETCLLTASETMEPTDMSRRIFSDYAEQAARKLTAKMRRVRAGLTRRERIFKFNLFL